MLRSVSAPSVREANDDSPSSTEISEMPCVVWLWAVAWPGGHDSGPARPIYKGRDDDIAFELFMPTRSPRADTPDTPFSLLLAMRLHVDEGGTGKDVLGWGARAMRTGGHA